MTGIASAASSAAASWTPSASRCTASESGYRVGQVKRPVLIVSAFLVIALVIPTTGSAGIKQRFFHTLDGNDLLRDAQGHQDAPEAPPQDQGLSGRGAL